MKRATRLLLWMLFGIALVVRHWSCAESAQDRAMAHLGAMASVQTDPSLPGNPVVGLFVQYPYSWPLYMRRTFPELRSVSGSIGSDADLEQAAAIPRLREVNLQIGGECSNRGVAILTAAPGLESLTLICDSISASALEGFKGSQRLTRLSITFTGGMKVDELGFVSSLTSLKNLQLISRRRIDTEKQVGRMFDGFDRLTGLADLSLIGGFVADEDLKALSGFTKLNRLVVDGGRLTDDALKHAASAPALLDLSATGPFTNAGVRKLEALRQLTTLNIHSNSITDDAVDSLLRMPSLLKVDLTGTSIGNVGLKRLASHPALTLISHNSAELTLKELQALRAAAPRVKLFLPASGKR